MIIREEERGRGGRAAAFMEVVVDDMKNWFNGVQSRGIDDKYFGMMVSRSAWTIRVVSSEDLEANSHGRTRVIQLQASGTHDIN